MPMWSEDGIDTATNPLAPARKRRSWKGVRRAVVVPWVVGVVWMGGRSGAAAAGVRLRMGPWSSVACHRLVASHLGFWTKELCVAHVITFFIG